MKVIFLDIDGVLTTDRTQYKSADPECMARLNTLVETTGAKVVLTSTRRFDKGIRELLRSWGARFEIWGFTQSKEEQEYGFLLSGKKIEEIYDWVIHSKEPVTQFVIIDDESYGNNSPGSVYIRTNMIYGFQDHDYKKALEMLK